MGKSLFQKVWEAHTVRTLPDGRTQLFIGLHLIHEVTTPQAFGMMRDLDLSVAHPERTFATVDHIIPTDTRLRPFRDNLAEQMTVRAHRQLQASSAFASSTSNSGQQGIVHVVGPEQGLTQPGMTICCGDSHTSTHGALGAVAFGIGTSQVRDVLSTQTLAMAPLKVRRIEIDGQARRGRVRQGRHPAHHPQARRQRRHRLRLRVSRAAPSSAMSMDERMTLCNMSIEGGARVGYVNPDEITFAYLQGPPVRAQGRGLGARASPTGGRSRRTPTPATTTWCSFAPRTSRPASPGASTRARSSPSTSRCPRPRPLPENERPNVVDALTYMQLTAGKPIKGEKVDVTFIGSCTNSRLSDLREVAKHVKGQARWPAA